MQNIKLLLLLRILPLLTIEFRSIVSCNKTTDGNCNRNTANEKCAERSYTLINIEWKLTIAGSVAVE